MTFGYVCSACLAYGLNEIAPNSYRHWIRGPQWMELFRRIRRGYLVGRGVWLGMGLRIQKPPTISKELSASYLPLEIWAFSCFCCHVFTLPSQGLILWNHKPNSTLFFLYKLLCSWCFTTVVKRKLRQLFRKGSRGDRRFWFQLLLAAKMWVNYLTSDVFSRIAFSTLQSCKCYMYSAENLH